MIYIDTGAFLARYIKKDQYHKKALLAWKQLEKKGKPCFTSNFVLDEMFTLLGRRAGNTFAAQRAHHIYASEVLTILMATDDDEREAIVLFEKFADQKVSFTDCISFVLMRKKKIIDVFSFDRDFEKAGFRLWNSYI